MSFLAFFRSQLGVVHLLRSLFRGEGVKEFVTVHTKDFFFFGKFVTMGGGGFEKVVF